MIRIGNKKFKYDGKTFYVGRPSPLGNPFPTKRNSFTEKIYTVEESLKLYRRWLWSKIKEKDAAVLSALETIANAEEITLLCWCVDENGNGECHARTIVECLEWMEKEQNEKMQKFEKSINAIKSLGSAAMAAASSTATLTETVKSSAAMAFPELIFLPINTILETFQKNTTLKARAILMDLFWYEIAVKGSVLDVQGDGETFPGTVRLKISPSDRAEHQAFEVVADFKAGPETAIYKKLLELEKGQNVIIAGTIEFLTHNTARLKDCRIIEKL